MGLFDKIKDVIGDIAPIVLPVAINAFLPGLGTVASVSYTHLTLPTIDRV